MAYSTGSATGVNDLVDKLATFIEANGWTRDSLGNEGSGRRYHAHNGSQYLNVRAHTNETVNSNVAQSSSGNSANVYGVAINIGTGYSGASAWYNQAGVPQGLSSKYMTAGIQRVTGAIPTYHFFAHNSGANIVCVVEYSAGFFQYFAFGVLAKYGSFTGGDYFIGSDTGVSSFAWGSSFLSPPLGFISSPVANTSAAFIKATVDAEAGWKFAQNNAANPTGVRRILDNITRFSGGLAIQPNTFNSVSVLVPVKAHCYRDTTNDATSNRSPLGEIPNVFFVTMKTLTPGQQVAVGSDNYRVFPFFTKDATTDTPSSAGSGHTATYGYAVQE